jgi:hypothetical protein
MVKRSAEAGATLRVDQPSQLCGSPGKGRANASGQSCYSHGVRADRPYHRRAHPVTAHVDAVVRIASPRGYEVTTWLK